MMRDEWRRKCWNVDSNLEPEKKTNRSLEMENETLNNYWRTKNEALNNHWKMENETLNNHWKTKNEALNIESKELVEDKKKLRDFMSKRFKDSE